MAGTDGDTGESAAVEHQDFCDPKRHRDPAEGCSTTNVDTHGLITHLEQDDDGDLEAYCEPRSRTPLALSAAACFDIAARFACLGQHILHHRV